MIKVDRIETIKVLQIVFVWGSGGVERLITNYVQNLPNVKIDVLVIQECQMNSIFTDSINFHGGEIESIGACNGNFFQRLYGRITKIKNFCASHNYDIIHVNGGTSIDISYAYAAKKGSPKSKVIMQSHADNVEPPDVFKKKISHHLFKSLLCDAPDCYLACSKNSLEWMFTKKCLNKKSSFVLNNGIDLEHFKYDSAAREIVREKLQISDKFVIGTVGRLAHQKNPYFILDIVKELVCINPKAVMLWVGDGMMLNEIKSVAKNIGIDSNIIFIGSVKEVLPYYLAMDVFILPSVYEGLGIVNVEAQATGLKCLVSDVIPKEAKVSPLLEYYSTKKSSKEWAIKLNSINNGYNRIDHRKNIKKAGYDMEDSALKLEEYYKLLLEM